MLKLIPQENPSKQSPKAKSSKQKAKKTMMQRLEIELTRDNKILHMTYHKLVDFLKKTEKKSLKEVGDMIHILRHSALSLERKRQRMMREERKKK